jgi:hypothetical protein
MEEGGNELLSFAEVRGLVGELLVLDNYFSNRLGHVDAVNAWCGPFGSAQDFLIADEAWEVKTIYPDSTAIQISSENQLDSRSRTIKLAVISLYEIVGNSGYTLNELVSRLRVRMEDNPLARDAFDERLDVLGYLARNEYDSPRFKVGKARTFQVQEGFPCIREKDLPHGVMEVQYKVQLDACSFYEFEPPFTLV